MSNVHPLPPRRSQSSSSSGCGCGTVVFLIVLWLIVIEVLDHMESRAETETEMTPSPTVDVSDVCEDAVEAYNEPVVDGPDVDDWCYDFEERRGGN